MKNIFLENKKSGFTFIELMFAVVILSFGLVAVMRSFLITLEGIGRSEYILAAVDLLEAKMEEVKQTAQEKNGIEVGQATGQFESVGGKHFSWQLNVSPSGFSEEFNEAELIVAWQKRNQPQQLMATVYLKSPEKQK